MWAETELGYSMSNTGNHRCTTPVPGALVAHTVVGLKEIELGGR